MADDHEARAAAGRPRRTWVTTGRRFDRAHPERRYGVSPAARDRIVLRRSPHLRRLTGVTQVVPPGYGAVVDTRYAHTLRVAVIARSAVHRLLRGPAGSALRPVLDRDVVEAAALLHDVGHPPFGHTGEAALDEALERHGVREGFDANAQSFRVATRLARTGAGVPGLNLTRATLAASLKYPFTHDEAPMGKFGVYVDDVPMLRWVKEAEADAWPTLEASLVDCADEIAYTVQDLIEFSRAGVVPLAEISRDTLAMGIRAEAVARILRRRGRVRHAPSQGTVRQALEVLDDVLRDGPRQSGRLTGWRAVRRHLLQRYVGAIEVERANDGFSVRLPPCLRLELQVLLELTRAYAFTPHLETLQRHQAHTLASVFRSYVEACLQRSDGSDRLPLPLPPELLDDRPHDQRLRAIADVVSGMTESGVRQLHRQLM